MQVFVHQVLNLVPIRALREADFGRLSDQLQSVRASARPGVLARDASFEGSSPPGRPIRD